MFYDLTFTMLQTKQKIMPCLNGVQWLFHGANIEDRHIYSNLGKCIGSYKYSVQNLEWHLTFEWMESYYEEHNLGDVLEEEWYVDTL